MKIRRSHFLIALLLICVTAAAQTYVHSLRVGGGFGATGLTADTAGNVSMDGDLVVGGSVTADSVTAPGSTIEGDLIVEGTITAGSTPHVLTNAAGLVDGAKLQADTVDLSAATNIAVTSPIVLTDDTLSAPTAALTTGKLSQFAATTSAELAGVVSNETGTGALALANTPTLTTPNIGAATGTSVALTGNSSIDGSLTSGGLTVGTSSGNYRYVQINSTAASSAGLVLRSANAIRWMLATIETTDNLQLRRYTGAAGSEVFDTPLLVASSDGAVTLSKPITLSSTIAATGISASGGTSTTGALADREYTPTLTLPTNLDSVTNVYGTWSRVGQRVTMLVAVTADATFISTITSFRVSLPVASAFTGIDGYGSGALVYPATATAISVAPDAVNDAILCLYSSNSTSATTVVIWAMYTVK